MNVLVVDGNPMLRVYFSGLAGLAFDGAAVHIAGDLDRALEAARSRAPDLVLLDLGLPGCDGIESLLRFRRQFPRVRVVAMSAVEDPPTIRDALAAGAAGYIPKTSSPKLVMSKLKLIVEGANGGATA